MRGSKTQKQKKAKKLGRIASLFGGRILKNAQSFELCSKVGYADKPGFRRSNAKDRFGQMLSVPSEKLPLKHLD